jgi:trk system potassium uptake protein
MKALKFYKNPDHNILLIQKLFKINSRLIRLWSFLAFGLVIYDLGFRKTVHEGSIELFYNALLLLLALGTSIRLLYKKDRSSLPRFLVEIGIIGFILFAASVNLGILQWELANRVANLNFQYFLTNLLISISFFIELSKLTLKVNRFHLNPSLIFILSFILVIIMGTGLLSMPNATVSGISFIDALFTSTSAVCVTGLIVLDTSSDFTFLGQCIIMALFQIGGLGMMTFTSFFGFFFKGSYSLQNQLFLKNVINEESMNKINSTLIKIIFFTLIIEGLAAISIYSLIDPKLFENSGDQLFFSIFHAISAFCNAGFSTLSNGLFESGFQIQYHVHLTIAFAIIIGGIGFPVMLNCYNYFKHLWSGSQKKLFRHEKYQHLSRGVNINTKLILITSGWLLLTGFVFYYLFEQNHTLKGLSGYGKFVTAFFGSVTPRTAGFNTVDLTQMAAPTILIYLILMWIGASPGSTGGGLKTSTFAVAVLNAISVAKGKARTEVFYREISNESIRKAFGTILLSFLIIGLGVFLVTLFDPEKNLIAVAFEIFSAFSTVGLSLGITGDLSPLSKIVVTIIMFLGRVGTLTVMVALIRKATTQRYHFPTENVYII